MLIFFLNLNKYYIHILCVLNMLKYIHVKYLSIYTLMLSYGQPAVTMLAGLSMYTWYCMRSNQCYICDLCSFVVRKNVRKEFWCFKSRVKTCQSRWSENVSINVYIYTTCCCCFKPDYVTAVQGVYKALLCVLKH